MINPYFDVTDLRELVRESVDDSSLVPAAADKIDELLKRFPNSASLHCIRARVADLHGDVAAEANPRYQRAAEIDPFHPESLEGLGDNSGKTKCFADAEFWYRESLEARQTADAYIALIHNLDLQAKIPDSVEIAEEAIRFACSQLRRIVEGIVECELNDQIKYNTSELTDFCNSISQ